MKVSGISMSFRLWVMYTSPEQNIPAKRTIIIIDEALNEGIRKQLVIAKNPQANNTFNSYFFIGNSGNLSTSFENSGDYQF